MPVYQENRVGKILILTEAGEGIGLGHYTRCGALLDGMLKRGLDVEMQIFLKNTTLDDPLVTDRNWLQEDHAELSEKYSIILVDSYLVDQARLNKLRDQAEKLVMLDDFNRIIFPVDLVINPNVFYYQMDYSNQVGEVIGGKDYVILRPEFRVGICEDWANEKIETVLITIGGSDYRYLLRCLIHTCLSTGAKQVVAVSPDGSANEMQSDRLTIFPSQNAKNMRDLMIEADVVVSGCGQTLHELAALQKPVIGICMDKDQVPNQKFYLNQGILLTYIKWDDEDLAEKITSAFEELAEVRVRSEIQQISRNAINKNGYMNVIDRILL